MTTAADEAQVLAEQVRAMQGPIGSVRVLEAEVVVEPASDALSTVAKLVVSTGVFIDKLAHSARMRASVSETTSNVMRLVLEHDPDLTQTNRDQLRGAIAELLHAAVADVLLDASHDVEHFLRVYSGVHLIPKLQPTEGTP